MSAQKEAFHLDTAAMKRLRSWRMAKDYIAKHIIALGGVAVIIVLLLIFFYLFYVVLPLFKPAVIEVKGNYPLPEKVSGMTLSLAMEEYAQVGVRFTDAGHAIFFNVNDGSIIKDEKLPLLQAASVTSFAASYPQSATVAYGLSDGAVAIVSHRYKITYPQGKRLITPTLDYPFENGTITVSPDKSPLIHLAIQKGEEETTVAAVNDKGDVQILSITKEISFLSDEVKIQQLRSEIKGIGEGLFNVLITPNQRSLYLAYMDGTLLYYDISDKEDPKLIHDVKLTRNGESLTSIALLTGGTSIIAGTSSGRIAQWFPVRGKDGSFLLTFIREFHEQSAPITSIAPEHARKGFLAMDNSGNLGIYHATAHRNLLKKGISKNSASSLAISPRADAMLYEDENGNMRFYHVHNEHPDVSWSVLWQKVWYEGYQEPAYIWQSSAATDDYEPKFSLVPITFGTIKAAIYAMCFAIPLAILGAIYTAHFMHPRMRAIVKPSVEIMAALPTVILGFLAGLWLAPFAERNLMGIFALIFLEFPMIFLAAYIWSRLPYRVKHLIPEGWEAALLIPVVIFTAWISLEISPILEKIFFDGNLRWWLTNRLGISYDQRNSLIVGIAIGFAVIPTIFSITEDAIFGVPKHLVQGSLAMGATPWQTMQRVVLLTASPGIFSAIMIGLGRAVGETMIVLMATGNTAIMDWNLFEGFRALSANIAVEMPEAEVHSTHFRVLFLSGLVLFGMTFFFNTLAEIVRDKLRKKYSTL